MERNIKLLPIAALFAAAVSLAACGKHEDAQAPAAAGSAPPPAQTAAAPAPAPAGVSVGSVELGNAVDASNKVATPATSFAPKDTIYASIATEGSGSAKLDIKWTYQDGQTVNEDSTTVDATGPGSTAFHISKPDGFPAGGYKVQVSLDGKPVADKDFTVK